MTMVKGPKCMADQKIVYFPNDQNYSGLQLSLPLYCIVSCPSCCLVKLEASE